MTHFQISRQETTKGPIPYGIALFYHETPGIRTPDNLIKSQVLYRLS